MRAILFVGLPGCGKSTLAAETPGVVEINRDAIRARLFGSRTHHAHEGAVSREHARLIRHHAANGDDLLISDTHSQRRSRRDLIRVLHELGYRVEVWVFDVAESTCQARNTARPQPVPPEVIARMSRRLRDCPPSLAEGMDVLRVIRQDGIPPLFTPAGIAPGEYARPRPAATPTETGPAPWPATLGPNPAAPGLPPGPEAGRGPAGPGPG